MGAQSRRNPVGAKKPRDVPGPTEPGPHSEPTTTPPFCLPLALPSRESFSRITPKVTANLEPNLPEYCTFLLACMCDCAVRRPLHLAVQVPHTYPFFPEPSSLALLPIPTPATPSRPFPSSTRPVTLLTRVRVNVRLHQRLHHLFSFSSSALFFNPRWNHSLLTSTRPTVSITVLLTITRSTTHARCVRLTLACQSLRPGPIDGSLLGDTNLQFPDFLVTAYILEAETYNEAVINLSPWLDSQARARIYTSGSPSKIHIETNIETKALSKITFGPPAHRYYLERLRQKRTSHEATRTAIA
jgi:hypothetical protein